MTNLEKKMYQISTARGGNFQHYSGIEEELAGGGPLPACGGPEQEYRLWMRANEVYTEYWRSTHY